MNKKDLKDGDRLTLRNGEVYIYDNYDKIFDKGDIREDLTDIDAVEWDIVKVERIQVDENTFNGITNEYIVNMNNTPLYEIFNNNLSYQTIWEREKQPKIAIECDEGAFVIINGVTYVREDNRSNK